MPATVLIGVQWGDEGKAKILDALVPEMDIIVRYQGGSNAGHTVMVNNEKYAFHLVPSGILHEDKVCVIANGCVIEPCELVKEINSLTQRGVRIDSTNLMISERAHLVMPYHRILDQLSEKKKESSGEGKIGTTGRGIGPAYVDKVSRNGIRVIDLLNPDYLRERVKHRLSEINPLITAVYGMEPLDPSKMADEVLMYASVIAPFISDTSEYITFAVSTGKRLLFEGAQGSLLDIDHGTYPFVTSSNASSGGASTGSGLAPRNISMTLGIMKAYTTRVGSGPFPTELTDSIGDGLTTRGVEFGTTTGRRRRCGWFDAVGAKYAIDLSGIDALAVTKLDVLSGEPEIKICVAYEIDGKKVTRFPASINLLSKAKPIYETMPGWKESIEGVRFYYNLPMAARNYIDRLEELSEVEIKYIGVGRSRDAIIRVGE